MTEDRPAPARRRRRLWPAVAGLAAVALGLSLVGGLRSDGETPAAEGEPPTQLRDDPAPALTGRTLAGEPFDLADLRGEVVVVNVMASWCAPCRDELPLLAEAARRWSADGLRVVAVAVRDEERATRALLEETGAEDLTVIPDPDGVRAVHWGVTGVPETFVVDRAGRVRIWAVGAVTEEWVERRVVPLVRP